MWTLDQTDEYSKRLRKWPKKYGRELEALIDNLDSLFTALATGVKPEQAKQKFGYVHSEPKGLLAVDQSGGGGGLKASRLYTYPDCDEEVLYALTLGDKDSQSQDIKWCKEWVDSHLAPKDE